MFINSSVVRIISETGYLLGHRVKIECTMEIILLALVRLLTYELMMLVGLNRF